MADYYSILGLTKTATDIEIKTAFRRLAKIYHPDKNPNDPNAKLLFENILKAYNVLINPHTRRRYDNNISFTSSQPKSQKAHSSVNRKNRGQKEWSTDDEELKRREYYKQHYHHAKYKAAAQTQPAKPSYSDYKYLLFATPIAVGLLMLIISLFSSEPKTESVAEKEALTAEASNPNQFVERSNGDKPYGGFFGDIKTFNTNHVLQINNSSVYDAVVAVFDKKTDAYLQHAYLKPAYTVEFSKLPDTGVYWKCVLGKNWNQDKLFFNDKVSGGFDSIVQYQNWKTSPTLFSQEPQIELTLLYVLNDQLKNKQYISNEIDFFEKKQ